MAVSMCACVGYDIVHLSVCV